MSSVPTSAMPVPPAIPDPTPDDTAAAIAALADAAGQASVSLFNYRRDNPDAPDSARALNLEQALDQRSIDLRAQSIRLLGDQTGDAVRQMKDAARSVDDFLLGVKVGEARLEVANSVIALAGAALVGDAGGVLKAVVGVHDALKADEAAQQAAKKASA